MAYEQHYRKRYIEYIREVIGDTDELLFNADELLSYIEKHIATQLTTINVTAYNSRYRINTGCYCGGPVYLLDITGGIADAVYILDEADGWIIFDSLDPENLAAAPTDGDTIEVAFYTINTSSLLSEIFFVLSSNHTKLVSAQNIAGMSMNLTQLADAFYAQSVRWAIE